MGNSCTLFFWMYGSVGREHSILFVFGWWYPRIVKLISVFNCAFSFLSIYFWVRTEKIFVSSLVFFHVSSLSGIVEFLLEFVVPVPGSDLSLFVLLLVVPCYWETSRNLGLITENIFWFIANFLFVWHRILFYSLVSLKSSFNWFFVFFGALVGATSAQKTFPTPLGRAHSPHQPLLCSSVGLLYVHWFRKKHGRDSRIWYDRCDLWPSWLESSNIRAFGSYHHIQSTSPYHMVLCSSSHHSYAVYDRFMWQRVWHWMPPRSINMLHVGSKCFAITVLCVVPIQYWGSSNFL